MYRVLSLDGGGIRGLLTASILKKLCSDPELAGFLEPVDLIAGTSSGGLIALGLAHGLGHSTMAETVDAVVDVFTDGRKTFGPGLHWLLGGTLLWPKYGSRARSTQFHRLLGDVTLGDLKKNVLIATFDLDNEGRNNEGVREDRRWEPKLFHNFEGQNTDRHELAWKVALYTTAGPVYFPTAEGFIDGGVYSNNPSMCALAQLFDARYRVPVRGADDVLLLSIGSGLNLKYVPGKTRRWGIFRWGVKFVHLTMDGTVGIADYQCRRMLTDEHYQRIQPHFAANTNFEIDDLGKIDDLRKFAEAFTIDPDVVSWLKTRWMAGVTRPAPAAGAALRAADPIRVRPAGGTPEGSFQAPPAAPRRLERDPSRDGFMNRVWFYVLTRGRGVWQFVQSVPLLEGFVNAGLINHAIGYAPTRPNPLSTRTPYTSWASLTDRTWFGRHLPPRDPRGLKPVDAVLPLFVRGKDMRPCRKSTALFSYFAQWFTDGILRSDFRVFPRNPLKNTSNHDIDLCNLYGLVESHTELLREHHGGRLRSQMIAGDEYPPFYYRRDDDGDLVQDESGKWIPAFPGLPAPLESPKHPLSDEQRKHLFAMGGERANITPGYAMMNTLFLREHNRIASLLERAYRSWDDERLFQTARNVTIVLLLKIVIEDYINHIAPYHFKFRLGAGRRIKNAWHRPNWVTLEFNLLYRWHSLTPEEVWIGETRCPMTKALWNNRLLIDHGLAQGFDGATRQHAGEIGLFNTPDWLAEMADRPSLEIGRQAQLASYNDYREWCGFPRVTSVDQISSNPDVRAGLMDVYGHVDAIELYTGLFAEDIRPRSALAPLMGRMVGIDAFSQALTNPLISDEVYRDTTFSEIGLDCIAKTASLDDIVARNVRNAAPVSFTHASFAAQPPKGVHMPMPDDANARRGIIAAFQQKSAARLEAAEAAGQPHPAMQRGAHPKHHGIVRATFRVPPRPDGDANADLALGLFAKEGEYPAYVRFSNASSDPKHDGVPDARGMAIKVMGVDGKKLIDDEARTQDFVLVNSPIFFTATPQGFLDFLLLRGKLAAAKGAGAPTGEIEKELTERFGLAQALQKTIRNPLKERYWSQTPYALGGSAIVKYLAEPEQVDRPLSVAEAMANPDPDYLRAAMVETLRNGRFTFAFKMQRRLPEMPVDDPTVEWDAERSPFVTVATIEILAQEFSSPAQMAFAENVVFNPWHALEVHRPLGRINEARRDVYLEMVKFRHGRNGVERREPTGIDDFARARVAAPVYARTDG